jgi:hypothetical protein
MLYDLSASRKTSVNLIEVAVNRYVVSPIMATKGYSDSWEARHRD